MPRASRPWFRFYTEAVADQKLRTLSPVHRWLWVALLSAARMSPEPGVLLVSADIPHTKATLADLAAVRERDVVAGLAEFEKRHMVAEDTERGCWVVIHFGDRQYESDTSTARTRKHRVKATGNGAGNDVGTFQNCSGNADGNAPDTEAENRGSTAGRKRPPKDEPRGYTKAERDPIFSALSGVFGAPETRTTRSFFGKAVTELLDAGATADQVTERGKRLLAKGWPDCTPAALLKHWTGLAADTNGHRAGYDPDRLSRSGT